MITLHCPVCDRLIEGESPPALPYLPFCSERCKLIDLGRWLGGAYRIPAPETGTDEAGDDPDAPPTPPS